MGSGSASRLSHSRPAGPPGLLLIEKRISDHEGELARATAAADREAIGRASRELRYWAARRSTAEVVESATDADRLVFGTAVTVLREDDTKATFRIVGEDEADPARGSIAWTAPVARALLGSRPGDVRELLTGEVEILSLDPSPEPTE